MAWLGTGICLLCATPGGNLADYFLPMTQEPENRTPAARCSMTEDVDFLGFFLVAFLDGGLERLFLRGFL
jgi:hypothetical protein